MSREITNSSYKQKNESFDQVHIFKQWGTAIKFLKKNVRGVKKGLFTAKAPQAKPLIDSACLIESLKKGANPCRR